MIVTLLMKGDMISHPLAVTPRRGRVPRDMSFEGGGE